MKGPWGSPFSFVSRPNPHLNFGKHYCISFLLLIHTTALLSRDPRPAIRRPTQRYAASVKTFFKMGGLPLLRSEGLIGLARVDPCTRLYPLSYWADARYAYAPVSPDWSNRGVVKVESRLRHSPIRRAYSLRSSFQPCKATSDDSRRAVTGENILLNKETLEQELQIAIDEENYVEAAKIRDRIRLLHEDCEASILAVNALFYNAFRTGDLSAMQTLWAKHDNVCCVHPGAGGITGYEFVMRSWEYVWVDYDFPLDIQLKDVRVHVRGDMGYVTCMELVRTKGSSWGKQFATNVFERVDDQWLICNHHASPVDL